LVRPGPSVREKSNRDLLSGAVPASSVLAVDLHPRLSWHCGPGQPDTVTQCSSFCSGAGSGLVGLESGENRRIFVALLQVETLRGCFCPWKSAAPVRCWVCSNPSGLALYSSRCLGCIDGTL